MVRAPFSLYIHIPFCTLKCSYCDFNSYAGIEELMEPFVEALVAEMRLWGEATRGAGKSEIGGRKSGIEKDRRGVETVLFGGGTPSLLPLEELERIMAALRESFDLDAQAEVSLEANPGTVDFAYLRGLVASGINRLSFGVQSFHDDELVAMDRIHSAEEAKEGYRWAREAGFKRINLDLIYGLPEQRMERWQATLEQAIELAPEHLSLYALTVEEGTKLAHDIDRGLAAGPDDDMQAEMYEWSSERLAAAGYRQYEISNWSRTGEECRHNLVYWRNGEWLGLGPGAHSQMTDGTAYRFADVYSPKQYIKRVQETVDGWSKEQRARSQDGTAEVLKSLRQVTFVEEQSFEMAMADTVILGLRLNEGLDVREFTRRFGRDVVDVYGPVFSEMTEFGLLERVDGRIRLTARGRLLANEVFVRLLPG
jgi:oxygen-independent coproporphyrinogen-3 oxidase